MMNKKKLMQNEEKFFKKYGLICSCRPGFVVCKNCRRYYNGILARLWLKVDPFADRN